VLLLLLLLLLLLVLLVLLLVLLLLLCRYGYRIQGQESIKHPCRGHGQTKCWSRSGAGCCRS
jgi:uncharacterized protein HemY